jgi:hypothetical protein
VRSSTVLLPEAAARLDTIGRADVMVGIPSFNNARTIGTWCAPSAQAW